MVPLIDSMRRFFTCTDDLGFWRWTVACNVSGADRERFRLLALGYRHTRPRLGRHVDLLMGSKDDFGQLYIHREQYFDEFAELPASQYFVQFGAAEDISTAVHDIDGAPPLVIAAVDSVRPE